MPAAFCLLLVLYLLLAALAGLAWTLSASSQRPVSTRPCATSCAHSFRTRTDTRRALPPPSQLLISKKSRRSREQAFVEFESVESATAAIASLDGADPPALVKQAGCGGLVVRFADSKKDEE